MRYLGDHRTEPCKSTGFRIYKCLSPSDRKKLGLDDTCGSYVAVYYNKTRNTTFIYQFSPQTEDSVYGQIGYLQTTFEGFPLTRYNSLGIRIE